MSGDPNKPLRFTPVDNPFQALTDSERQEFVATFAAETKTRVDEIFENMNAALERFYPFQLIAQLAAYGLTVIDEQEKVEN